LLVAIKRYVFLMLTGLFGLWGALWLCGSWDSGWYWWGAWCV